MHTAKRPRLRLINLQPDRRIQKLLEQRACREIAGVMHQEANRLGPAHPWTRNLRRMALEWDDIATELELDPN